MNLLRFLFSKSLLKQIGLAIIACIVFAFLTLKWLKSYTHHASFVLVPDLTGIPLDSAQNLLNDYTLKSVVLDSSNYHPNFSKGAVIEQDPIPNSQVKTQRKIYLSLNPSSYQKIKVPYMVGRTFRQAKPTLEVLGFKIGNITYVDDLGKDEVLQLRYKGQIIDENTKLEKTSVIDLVLGNGRSK